MNGLTSFLQIGAFVIAILTVYRALSEYGKNNLFKRAAVLEDLIGKFKKPELLVAKRLLDDFEEFYFKGMIKGANLDPGQISEPVIFIHTNYKFNKCLAERIEPEKNIFKICIEDQAVVEKSPNKGTSIFYADQNFPNSKSFTFMHLKHLLRTHEKDFISDNEIYFRDSFDELLDFTLLLIYYLRNEIISMREVQAHFLFYIKKIKKNDAVLSYIKIYYSEEDFNWLFRQLPPDDEEPA